VSRSLKLKLKVNTFSHPTCWRYINESIIIIIIIILKLKLKQLTKNSVLYRSSIRGPQLGVIVSEFRNSN